MVNMLFWFAVFSVLVIMLTNLSVCDVISAFDFWANQEAQLLLGDRATRKHAKDS